LQPAGTGFEIGIGTGIFAERLGIRMGNDPSEEMLKVARSRKLIVQRCTGENLPFPDSIFDYTLMVTTLCFLNAPLIVLRECWRVTKMDGAILIAFLDSESPIGISYRNKVSRSFFYRDATFYSISQVKKMLEETGFAVDKVRQTLFGTLKTITEAQKAREGTGEGSFVVVRARKRRNKG
jgi:ubiquinone/menaquinone biosynthesis C-methylase UbiE